MQTTQNPISSPFYSWLAVLNSFNWNDDRNYYQYARQTFLEARRLGISQPQAFFVVANRIDRAGKTVGWGKLHELWHTVRGWNAKASGQDAKPAPELGLAKNGHSIQPAVLDGYIANKLSHDLFTDPLVIDGKNVIYGSPSDPQPSLLNLFGLLLELHKRKRAYKCFFDANTYFTLMETGKKAEAYAYRRFCHDFPDIFIEVPGGNQADDFLLDYAHSQGAPVISNDRYRDYLRKYQWLNTDPKRRVSFVVHSNLMQVVSLGFTAAIPKELVVAEASLRTSFGNRTKVIKN